MLKFKYDYPIQYQDVDGSRHLRLYTLENFLLNSAGLAADVLGIGSKWLTPKGMTWVLTNVTMEIDRLPRYNQTLTVETWVEDFAHMLSPRNYALYIDGEKAGQVRTVWAVISLEDRTIQNIFDYPEFAPIERGEKLEMARIRHGAALTEPDGVWEHTIVYSDIDYNGHCNSCKYLEFMLNAHQPAFLGEPLILDMKYAKEVHKGEAIRVLYKQIDEQTIRYEVRTAADNTLCVGGVIRKK